VHIGTDIKPATVDGDPRLIEQLIQNLIDNAILHNMTGGNVHLITAMQDGHGVLAISNDGPLIPPTELERLFRPFERLEPGRLHRKTGHGLGLSIVDAIATAHGATMTAGSRPEGGLAIEIAFPSPNPTPPGGDDSSPERKSRRATASP